MLGNVIYTDSMHSFTTHESRNLKQARPKGQYVDLLRYTLATPSWDLLGILYHQESLLSNTFIIHFMYCVKADFYP